MLAQVLRDVGQDRHLARQYLFVRCSYVEVIMMTSMTSAIKITGIVIIMMITIDRSSDHVDVYHNVGSCRVGRHLGDKGDSNANDCRDPSVIL